MNKIIPYWYGTPWSFEGHTSIPREGEIACGYFVSNTLRDVGLKLNRYLLAQQLPINEAKSLNIERAVLVIEEQSTIENIKELREVMKEGGYFIGFDENHVGFVLKKENDLFLIHSNYYDVNGVGIERIETSEVFAAYTKFYLAEISKNIELLKKWKNGEKLEVFMP